MTHNIAPPPMSDEDILMALTGREEGSASELVLAMCRSVAKFRDDQWSQRIEPVGYNLNGESLYRIKDQS